MIKKVINGKLYNTETAKKLAEYDNGLSYSDFNQLFEALYKTPKGTFFLAGHGGARTKYAVSYGRCLSAGEDIVPIDENTAREWVEKFANDKYEEIFGAVEEA